MKKNIYSIILISALIPLFLGFKGNTKAAAQSILRTIRLVRSLESEETGILNPVGITFSSKAEAYHVTSVFMGNQPLPAFQKIQSLNRFGDQFGSALIGASIGDPINIAFNDSSNKLLIFQISTDSLIEVSQDLKGNLKASSLITTDFRRFDIQDPQGISVDPASGILFVLDKNGPRIVNVKPERDGDFGDGVATSINLSAIGTTNLRGLAIDPSTGNLFVGSPSEMRLYELNRSGEVVSIYDLSTFGIDHLQGMIFAPSGDQTDDPGVMSLFLSDSGVPLVGEQVLRDSQELLQTESFLSAGTTDALSTGRIYEFSLVAGPIIQAASFTSAVVNKIDLSAITPPSPDVTGITYNVDNGTLVISDGEVEETVGQITHWDGANVWEMSLTGVLQNTADVTALYNVNGFTNEPAGIAYNPSNNHYYFVDDNMDVIFDLDPGTDSLIGTEDDVILSFDATTGSGDSEGLTYAYDGTDNVLFVSDGVNSEIYKYGLDGDNWGTLLGQFDTMQFGIVNPNSVDFNPVSNTLVIISNSVVDVIAETTLDGQLLRIVDLSEIALVSPDGLAYAPASDGTPNLYHYYIADRGVDNNYDPYAVDGKIWETTAPSPFSTGNQPLIVDAGMDQSLILPTNSAMLDGSLIDDNFPVAATTLWSQVSGACVATYENSSAIDTTVTFPFAGRYVLLLEANDTELNAWDTLVVKVERPSPSKVFDSHIEMGSDDAEEILGGNIRLSGSTIELGEHLTNGPQTNGFRFNWLDIPPGARIINAYIQFTSHDTDTVSASLVIKGEASADAATFTSTAGNITSRQTTSAFVNWNVSAWSSIGDHGINQKTPNLVTVLQEIVNQPGWKKGNSAVFIITGIGTRRAFGYEGDPCSAAYLHVEWDTQPAATNDSYSTPVNTPLIVGLPGVLINDSDADGDPLAAVLVAAPVSGNLTFNQNGSFSYIPATDFNGEVTFTYKVNDGTLDSNTTSVVVNVEEMNYTLSLPAMFK